MQRVKIPGTVSSMDLNAKNNLLIAGGKETIKIYDVNVDREDWLELKKSINRHKNATQTKVCVSELSWNKYGEEFVIVGTTNGFLYVYDIGSGNKTILSAKGHDGNIKNVVWVPKSCQSFISSAYENELKLWDMRQSYKEATQKVEYPESIKIRDIKFSPHNPNLLAVQCHSALKIVDFRMLSRDVVTKHIKDNELQAFKMQWDPLQKDRLASGVSREINILSFQNESSLRLEETLSHYSLIKSFEWMRTRKNVFGVSGETPEKNICFYDLDDKDRVSFMYGGHNKTIQCWIMDQKEQLIFSASNAKEKNNVKTSYGQIIVQQTENFIDPNEARLDHPLNFDNDSSLAFSFTINPDSVQPLHSDKGSLSSKNNKSSESPFEKLTDHKNKVCFPVVFQNYHEQTEPSKGRMEPLVKFKDLKEELTYFHRNYLFQDSKNETIAQKNSQVAERCGRRLCSEFWKIIFAIASPEDQKEPSLESIYEEGIKADVIFVDNRIILNSKSSLIRQSKHLDVNSLLQFMVDENQLQTAVVASIILLNRCPDPAPGSKLDSIINENFLNSSLSSYIEILRNLELYTIASETILKTKLQRFTQSTIMNTKYHLTCGWCKESITKGNCKCNLLCVLCQERLNQRMVIWCKYCGHGGHATEYYKYFQDADNKTCPHGCGHECFRTGDFDY